MQHQNPPLTLTVQQPLSRALRVKGGMRYMQHTTNYNLPQWEASDTIKRSDVNGAMSTLDAAVKAVADTVAGGATVVYGSYVGNGKSGSLYPNTLTFAKKPLLVFIANDFQAVFLQGARYATAYYDANSGKTNFLSWYDTTLRWYANNAISQLNTNGDTYYYVAILENA